MNRFLKNAFAPFLLMVNVVILTWYFTVTHKAHAEPKPGLWWTSKTSGLAQVQKLEDSSNGVVCYIAAHPSYSSGQPSISCVKP